MPGCQHKEADDRRYRCREIVDEKKKRPENGTLLNTSVDSKEATFVILKSRKRTCQKGRKVSRNNLLEKSEVLDRAKSLRKIKAKIVGEPGLGLLTTSEMD